MFAKGLVHRFFQNLEFFPYFVFGQNKPTKYCLLIFWIEKKAFFNIKISFPKSGKNSNFCKGVGPWYFQKVEFFPYFVFLEKKVKKSCLLIL